MSGVSWHWPLLGSLPLAGPLFRVVKMKVPLGLRWDGRALFQSYISTALSLPSGSTLKISILLYLQEETTATSDQAWVLNLRIEIKYLKIIILIGRKIYILQM